MVGRLRAYMAVVSAIGFVVLCVLAANVDLGRVRESLARGDPAGAGGAGGALPVDPAQPGRARPSVHVDTPFTFALVLAAEGAAAVVMAALCALYDLAHRKPLYKLTFNIGTHTISLAAGTSRLMALAGGQERQLGPAGDPGTGTAVFVAVKAALFVGSVALDEELRQVVSPARILRQSVLVVVMAQVGVLVLVLAAERPALLLLALRDARRLPAAAQRDQGGADRQDAEETARRRRSCESGAGGPASSGRLTR